MFELYNAATSYAVLPASVLLLLLLLWSLGTILLGMGSDFSLGDWLPSDGGVGGGSDHETAWQSIQHSLGDALGGVVMTPAKWLNLKDLPIVVWGGVFTLVWWTVSILMVFFCDSFLFGKEPGGLWIAGMIVRNVLIALIATKLITQPMRDWFVNHELGSRELVGQEVLIASYDASPTHGQAKFKTDGAPLLLNIRTDGPVLIKGTRAWITHYDANSRIYIVSATTTSSSITSN